MNGVLSFLMDSGMGSVFPDDPCRLTWSHVHTGEGQEEEVERPRKRAAEDAAEPPDARSKRARNFDEAAAGYYYFTCSCLPLSSRYGTAI